ncbi:MAG: hypothetical protein GY754_44095 [bacterium]|nr:hypothetical protein [bacterium]
MGFVALLQQRTAEDAGFAAFIRGFFRYVRFRGWFSRSRLIEKEAS